MQGNTVKSRYIKLANIMFDNEHKHNEHISVVEYGASGGNAKAMVDPEHIPLKIYLRAKKQLWCLW